MKKIHLSLIFLIFLNGCASYEPDILYPVENINELYIQCRNSEGMNPESTGQLSFSDRYYCLGYVQAMAESTIYWRKQQGDINSQCRTTVKDFYHRFITMMDQGYFTENTDVTHVFRRLSYGLCPRTRR